MYMRFKVFSNPSILLFVLHILAFTKFQLRWCAPFQLLWTLFKSSFLPLRSLCKSDLQCFETFRNCCLFCTFWLLRNFYSGDAHHANYDKHNLHQHFQHSVNCVYKIYSVFKLFEFAVCFCTFWLLRNFYCGDAHHANYAKHNLHQHFQHSVNCVYQIYSVLKVFEIAVCFAHFGFCEISTPVIRTIPIIVNFD